MPLRKGQSPESFKQGKLQSKDLRSRSPEERKRISQMGVEARRKNSERKKLMKENLETLLQMKVSNSKQKNILKELGIQDEDMTNQMLLMVALFRKGMTGDVSAIKQVAEMMEEVGVNLGVSSPQGNITININSKSRDDVEEYKVQEQEVDIRDEQEQSESWEDVW